MPAANDRLILHTMFESLFERALKPEGAFADALRKVGYDPARPKPEYPEKVFLDSMEVARRYTEPNLSFTEAQRKFGRITGELIYETLVGKVIAVALPMLGPDRLMTQLPKRIEVGAKGSTGARIEKLADRSYRLSFPDRDNPLLEFSAGAIETTLVRCKVQPRVTVDPNRSIAALLITWEPLS